jgi:hypothetical protein
MLGCEFVGGNSFGLCDVYIFPLFDYQENIL